MLYFLATTHVSPQPIKFVGDSWEEGGFSVNDDCEPIADARGNTVARFESRPIQAEDSHLLKLAYAGEEAIEDGQHFAEFLAGECGCQNSLIAEVCRKLDVEYSTQKLAAYRESMAIRNPVDRLIDVVRKSD